MTQQKLIEENKNLKKEIEKLKEIIAGILKATSRAIAEEA